VAIYTRNATCAPIKAEEGITGVLTPPNSSTSFFDLPEDQRIGGYPTASQLAGTLDATTLDSEGRCVILEFPAFVLIGVYNPANRDESRDEFRLGFLNALDARVRNLVAAGKRVFLTGDLNIIREEIDTANAEEQLRKHGMTSEEYLSTPARRLLNQLIVDGKTFGEREEGREKSVMWDLCRSFHPRRRGMFTCWEQKINARPGNFGSRIDYVLCSYDWRDWFCESNIQEGLMGSDHCPVYAIIKSKVSVGDTQIDIRDIMNPPGTFINGIRQRDWGSKDLLSISARLIPEFDRRRNIRDMFTKIPSLTTKQSSATSSVVPEDSYSELSGTKTPLDVDESQVAFPPTSSTSFPATFDEFEKKSFSSKTTQVISKRNMENSSAFRPLKRGKSSGPKTIATSAKSQPGKAQSSLKGFFKPKGAIMEVSNQNSISNTDPMRESLAPSPLKTGDATSPSINDIFSSGGTFSHIPENDSIETDVAQVSPVKQFDMNDQEDVVDPIVSKESWSKLLSRRVAPLCEHNVECKSYVTKKPGINCGRSFYICSRPIGPSGTKEKGSEWRCGTFIWSSDWSGSES
jgi:AP endonuclease-2